MFRDSVGDLGLLTKKSTFCIGTQKSWDLPIHTPSNIHAKSFRGSTSMWGSLGGGCQQLGARALFIPELSFLVPASVVIEAGWLAL